ncbi:MAG TPA: AI-2E family transporter, partial [Sphingomicrobium sp.]|jgi:predicted PurR-regulated permease PerM|nr:AI-2E family transporter [Sphingomicrobium sp.]
MTFQRQIVFWILSLVALVFVLWLLKGILLPFIAGMVLAYFLDPVADALERLGLPRVAATLLILGLSTLLLVLALFLLVPVLVDQVGKFAANLPGIITTLVERFNEAAPVWVKELLQQSGSTLPGSASEIAGRAAGWIATLLTSILSGGLALVNLLSLVIVTPIVAFYLLTDWDRMVARLDSWLPRPHVETLRGLAREMDDAMAGFIRGQAVVCLLLGLFYAIGLSLAGLNFGLLIGLAAGILSFIPYVGSFIGFVLSISVAFVQFWPDWVHIAAVAAIFAAGQFIEGNFLSPKLVGNRVGLHPVWLMFALFAFGYLFGFAGLLMAVPLAAAVGVLTRFALRKYLSSPFYLGSEVASDVARRRLK